MNDELKQYLPEQFHEALRHCEKVAAGEESFLSPAQFDLPNALTALAEVRKENAELKSMVKELAMVAEAYNHRLPTSVASKAIEASKKLEGML